MLLRIFSQTFFCGVGEFFGLQHIKVVHMHQQEILASCMPEGPGCFLIHRLFCESPMPSKLLLPAFRSCVVEQGESV